jgi:hypothetical protein
MPALALIVPVATVTIQPFHPTFPLATNNSNWSQLQILARAFAEQAFGSPLSCSKATRSCHSYQLTQIWSFAESIENKPGQRSWRQESASRFLTTQPRPRPFNPFLLPAPMSSTPQQHHQHRSNGVLHLSVNIQHQTPHHRTPLSLS